MLKVRRLLVPVAVAWLFLHVCVVTGITIPLLTTGSVAADIVCTCAHRADHGSCPMHHEPADSARCRMRSTQDDLDLALVSMLGPLTLPVTSASAIIETSSLRQIGYRSKLPSDWTVPPDLPPPRS